jgi:hypothetical protein
MAKKYKYGEKAVRVMELLNNTNKTDHQIATAVGCHVVYVRSLRRKMAHKEAEVEKINEADEVIIRLRANICEVPPHQRHLITEHEWDGRGDRNWCRHGIDNMGEPCEVCRAEEDNAIAAEVEAPTTTDVDVILDERGTRYGSFVKQALISQRIKAVMSDTPNWISLEDDMVESLEMIASKMGRILNGDFNYADSWVDIAGYAQLIADRLNGKVR